MTAVLEPPPSAPREDERFVPAPPAARYEPPPASIHPDESLSWWRRMAPIVLAHKAIVASGLACALITLLLQLAIPRLIRYTFDRAVFPELALRTIPLLERRGIPVPEFFQQSLDRVDGKPTPLTTFLFVLAGVAAVRYVIGYFYRLNLQRTSFHIEYDLRNLMYQKFQRLSFSYFDKVQSGQLISRANSDIRSVQMFLSFAPTVVISMITFVVAFGLMATTHLLLALVALIPLPFVYLTGTKMRSQMFPVSWIISSRQADVATIVEENVTGTRVVKSFAQERSQVNTLADAAQRLRWAASLQVEVRARFSPFMQNLPRFGLAAVLLYGGWLVIEGKISLGTIIEFNAYVVMLQAPFMMLGFLMMMANRAAASAGRIFEVVDAPEEIVDSADAVNLDECQGDVRFENVAFGYAAAPGIPGLPPGMQLPPGVQLPAGVQLPPGVQLPAGFGNGNGEARANVLESFTLHLRPGETVALVGRTGSGKSTVARLLPRFYDVSGGAVLVDGHDVREVTLDSLRAHIGLVLDEPFLFSETIRENIRYGKPRASDDEIIAAATAAGAMEFVDKLPEGLDTLVGERGYTLSGGQRQRIAIARTLLVNPRILILDDATSAIDVHVEHEIHGALKTLMEGRTTLIIAHRLSTISLADRVVLLRDGRVFADGSHNELMATVPEYAEVLARAEEEWQEAHAPKPDPEEDLPPRMRAMRKMMQANAERGGPGGGGMGGAMPGMPMGGGAA